MPSPEESLKAREQYLESLSNLDFPDDFPNRVTRERRPENLQIMAAFSRSILSYLREAGYLDIFDGGFDPEIKVILREILTEVSHTIPTGSLMTISPSEVWGGHVLPNKRWILMTLRTNLRSLLRANLERKEKATLTSFISGHQETHAVAVGDLKTAFQEQLTQVLQQERIDPLTGLPRRASYDAYVELITREYPEDFVACVFFDLDHFKEVNDTYGHPAGDTVLRGVGQLLQGLTREGTAFRYGGEELVVVLHGNSQEELKMRAREIACSLRKQLEESRFADDKGSEIKVTVSAGIAVGKMPDYDEILGHADAAMYAAKGEAGGEGRNRVWVHGEEEPEPRE
ncbi:MAG: GGDEF domain-containing protein [Candidatus Gracilibacteria bacterium]